jgi:hypothetical protein
VLESSSDEDSDGETDLLMAAAGMVNEHFLMPPRRGGSCKQREGNVDRDREAGHVRLYKDYFDPINPLYKEKAFRRRYRISEGMLLVILNGVREYDDSSRPNTIALVRSTSLTKNVMRPFDNLHMECQVISLKITSA